MVIIVGLLLANSSCKYQITDSDGIVIAQYGIDSLSAKPDTVLLGDTVKVSARIVLDCTNRITRIDTLLDTMRIPPRVTVAIFGTVFTGPGPRPLCPARFFNENISLVLPRRGAWIIEAAQPPWRNWNLTDTVIVQ